MPSNKLDFSALTSASDEEAEVAKDVAKGADASQLRNLFFEVSWVFGVLDRGQRLIYL